MKILILSCNTGGGHNSAGKAMQQEIINNGDEAVFLDYLTLAGRSISGIVGNLYVETVKKVPALFGMIYRLGMFVSTHMKKSPVYYLNSRMAKHLQNYLANNPVDAIVMPHLYPAETLTYMKRKGIALPPTVVIMTDYTCIPFWEETDCDYYITPSSQLVQEIVRRGIPAHKLQNFGIPVSPDFNSAVTRQEARQRLSLSPSGKYILVAGGSMGAGNLLNFAKELAAATTSENILICSGSDAAAKLKLKMAFAHCTRVKIIGFTDKMPLYLKACDLIFTKPGGLTSTEAAVANIPIVHTAPIPGCETANRDFFTQHKMSVSASDTSAQIRKGLQLLRSEAAINRMRQAQSQYINKYASRQIYDFLKQIT